ncbi:MAG: hypothetical protein JWM11_2926, partial [Planctomycetaceae bacterium]|nr:hypothetical protein [Planctomycetaceae bacterium]
MTTTFSQTWDLQSLLPHPSTPEFASLMAKFREDLQQIAERSDVLPRVEGGSITTGAWSAFLSEYERIET